MQAPTVRLGLTWIDVFLSAATCHTFVRGKTNREISCRWLLNDFYEKCDYYQSVPLSRYRCMDPVLIMFLKADEVTHVICYDPQLFLRKPIRVILWTSWSMHNSRIIGVVRARILPKAHNTTVPRWTCMGSGKSPWEYPSWPPPVGLY